MTGTVGTRVALAGGNEFRAGSRAADGRLLELAGGVETQVVLLPTAAAHQQPEKAAATGIRHFQGLGARHVSALMILKRTDAANPALVEPVRRAGLIYLTGGDPRHLHDTLAGTLAWAAIGEAAQAGAIVVGSSAGAMVLAATPGADDRFAGVGLGLAPDCRVLVHHRGPVSSDAIGGLTVFGIAEETTWLRDGDRWQNLGSGSVWVYQAGRAPAEIAPGEVWAAPPRPNRGAW